MTMNQAEYIPITRVADRFHTTKHAVYRWLRNDRSFPAPIRLPGGTLRWRIAELDAWEAMAKINRDEFA